MIPEGTIGRLQVFQSFQLCKLKSVTVISDILFFLRNHNGNKSVQHFGAIPVAIHFFIVFREFYNYIVNKIFVYL